MNMIEKLLKVDAGKIETPTKEYEVKRLTKLFGFPFILQLRAIPPERYIEIQQNSVELKKGDVNKINMYDMQIKTILAGVTDPSFKDENLRRHFGAASPKDLINKIFLAGELSDISGEINKLCGYETQDEVDDVVKN